MEVNLVLVEGKPLGAVLPVKSRRFVIGRDDSCQLRPKNTAISKQHCAVIRHGQTIWVEDLGSSNGTLVNDRKLRTGDKVQVSDGDRLQVGQLIFTIQISSTPATGKARVVDWLKEGPTPHTEATANPGATMLLKELSPFRQIDENPPPNEPEKEAKPIIFSFRKYDLDRKVASIGLGQDLLGEEKMIRQLRRELFALAANPQYRRLVLDLSDVDALPSMACSMLLGLARRCKDAGGGLRLCGLQQDVDRVLDALKFNEEMGLFDDRLAAVGETWA